MPLLSKKWNEIPDNDRILFSLFECFELVIVAIGPLFEPFAANVFQRCLKILTNVLISFRVS